MTRLLTGAHVQWRRAQTNAMVLGMSEDDDLLARTGEKKPRRRLRMLVDIDEADVEFIARYAAYRTARDVNEGNNVPAWSRKSTIESFVKLQTDSIRQNMSEVFAELGPPPLTKDKKVMLAYVKSVDAFVAKRIKKR